MKIPRVESRDSASYRVPPRDGVRLELDDCQGSASVITMWQQDFVGEMKIPTSEGFVDKESGSLYFRFDDKLTTGI